eukprot:Skav223752  [mRNA]  locus=scaffold3575:390819:397326:- [translate_table: standard]
MPSGALFPAPVFAEVTTVSDIAPQRPGSGDELRRYLAVGHLAAGLTGEGPGPSTAMARFVKSGRQDSGPMPFAGQRNQLIHPPAGFACDLLGPPPHPVASEPLPSEPPLVRATNAPFDGDVQTLLLLEPMGHRELVMRFGDQQKVHTGQNLILGLEVLNPPVAVKQSSASNVWSVQLRSAGVLSGGTAYNLTWSFRASALVVGSERGIERLVMYHDPLVWPHSHASSRPGSARCGGGGLLDVQRGGAQLPVGHPAARPLRTWRLQRADRAAEGSTGGGPDLAPQGILVVDAPLDFDLSGCMLGRLEWNLVEPETLMALGDARFQRWQFALPGAPSQRLATAPALPLGTACPVSQTPQQRTRGSAQNRALLRMEGWMRQDVTYEFQLLVTNPLQASGDVDAWALTANFSLFFQEYPGLWR